MRDVEIGRAQRLDTLGAGATRGKHLAGLPQRDQGLLAAKDIGLIGCCGRAHQWLS